jgi:amino acid transporter
VRTDRLAASSGPLLEVAQVGPLAIDPQVFAAIALFAVANGALINMIMASRLIYGMAAQGIVPRGMGRVNGERQTPWVAIIFVAVLAFALVALGDLESLADTTVLLLLVVFTIVNVAALVLRGEQVGHEHFRAPAPFPLIGALVSAALAVHTATDDPEVLARAALLLAAGAALWAVNRAAAPGR